MSAQPDSPGLVEAFGKAGPAVTALLILGVISYVLGEKALDLVALNMARQTTIMDAQTDILQEWAEHARRQAGALEDIAECE